MTWARNYSDRNSAGSFETGKRAKKPARLCISCGTGIVSKFGGAKRCRPCAGDQAVAVARERGRRLRARKQEKAET